MTTPTIQQIKDQRDLVNKAIKKIRIKDYEGVTFGPENEYVAKGIVGGIKALLVDITALVNKPAQFIKMSTHSERSSIVTSLTNMNTFITSANLAALSDTVDSLKPIIYRYNVRHSDERREAFNEYIDKLQIEAVDISQQLEEIREIKETSSTLKSDIDTTSSELNQKAEDLKAQEEELEQLIGKLTKKRQNIEKLFEQDEENSSAIEQLFSDAKSHKEVIETFSKQVSNRESQLVDQETKTENYQKALSKYQQEQENILKEARSLISSAKKALEYKTAEGLSAAFIEKYNEAKEDKTTINWIYGAGVFIALAVGLGVWIVLDKSLDLKLIIGRVSLLPILLTGAWFCAAQYVKQKNIAEDYAYKSVLTKSLVGFADQLSEESTNGDEYSHYIKSVLNEIHNDPLRKRTSKSESHNEAREDIKELIKELKGLQSLSDKVDTLMSLNVKT